MKRYIALSVPVLVAVLIFITLNVLNPLSNGPAGILFIFTLIYLFFLSVFSLLIYFGSHALSRYRLVGGSRIVKPRKAYYIASALACFPVFLLAIRSIGSLSFVDIFLAGFFVFLASFYIAKRT